MPVKILRLIRAVIIAPKGAERVEAISNGKPVFTSTIFFLKKVMAAEIAAIPFKKRDADTAVVTGNFSRIKRGEKISPPPNPTIVRMKEARKIIINNKKDGIDVLN